MRTDVPTGTDSKKTLCHDGRHADATETPLGAPLKAYAEWWVVVLKPA